MYLFLYIFRCFLLWQRNSRQKVRWLPDMWHDVTVFLRKSGYFLRILGDFLSKVEREPGEKEKKTSTGENSNNTVETVPRKLQISAPRPGRTCPEQCVQDFDSTSGKENRFYCAEYEANGRQPIVPVHGVAFQRDSKQKLPWSCPLFCDIPFKKDRLKRGFRAEASLKLPFILGHPFQKDRLQVMTDSFCLAHAHAAAQWFEPCLS